MPRAKASCFISYCHADVDADTLEQFEGLLRTESEDCIEFIRDVKQPPGRDWDEFMSLLESVDATLVLLTPGFKSKVLNKSDGVYEEFRRIYTRFCQARDRRARDGLSDSSPPKSFLMIPVLLSGTKLLSVPTEIERINYEDFTHFHVSREEGREHKGKRIIIADSVRSRFVPKIKRIISSIDNTIIENIPDFKYTREKYFDLLLVDTKDEHLANQISKEKRNYIFVKTRSYEEIFKHKSFIIVGRKGSGKSTITSYIADQQPNAYKRRIHFYVDNINLDTLFQVEGFSLNKFISDSVFIKHQVDIMSIVWRVFIYHACCTILYIERHSGKLERDQVERGEKIFDYLEKIDYEIKFIREADFEIWPLFVFCFESVIRQVDKAIKESSNSIDKFIASVMAATSAQKLVLRCFPRSVHAALNDVALHCKRKFMFSFDGFDTRYEQFRHDTLLLQDPTLVKFRLNFEADWLRGIIHAVQDIRTNKYHEYLNNTIDFFLTIPKDRFLEIKDIERDAYIYRARYSLIGWTAIELMIMLRKRLELIDAKTDKVSDEIIRYYNFMEQFYPEFPRYMTVVHEKKTYRFETIFYILRHTFWRPRDVLYYMAELLARLDECRRRKREFTSELIKTCISHTTYEIIRSEFIGELRSICPNIEVLIRRFENGSQVLTFSEVSKIMSDIEIGFVYVVQKVETILDKLKFLYTIGFLGIGLTDMAMKQFRVGTAELFNFSDGDRIITGANLAEFQSFKFIIHPIFCEYLRLDTTQNDLVLNYTIPYILDNDLGNNR